MKNYVMTKNYKKAFRRLIICFVILAVISAVGIPLSLSQQIHDASVLKQQAALTSPDPTDNDDGHHYDAHHDEAWKSQITPLTAMNYVIIGAVIMLMGIWVILYWLTVVAWLYKSAAVAGMNLSLWAILGTFLNIFAVLAFWIVRDRPARA
ncbi:MAG: hypothetical protein MR552_04335 [Clostridiales bacterium]|nr:hypothetical protein [Clostridiales bacterium]